MFRCPIWFASSAVRFRAGVVYNLDTGSTDGVANMDSETLRCCENVALVCLSSCYQIWCASHHSYLVVQHFVTALFKVIPRDLFGCLTGYLRQQTRLRADGGSTCLAFTTAMWLSMSHHLNITSPWQNLALSLKPKRSVAPKPLLYIYILLAMGYCVMDHIDVCFNCIAEKDTLVPEKASRLQTLVENVNQPFGQSMSLTCTPLFWTSSVVEQY